MKLYLVSRVDDVGYDEYDSIIVAAHSPATALKVQPGGDLWPEQHLRVQLIGRVAGERQFKDGEIVLASFNAG